MPPTCSVQDHVDRPEIESIGSARAAERALAERYPTDGDERRLSRSALHRHLSRECACRPAAPGEAFPIEVEGWRIGDDGRSIVDAATGRVELLPSDSTFAAIAAVLGLGADRESAVSPISKSVGDVEALKKDLELEAARLERESKALEIAPGQYRSPHGAMLELAETLRCWSSRLDRPEEELRFLKDLDHRNGIASTEWFDGGAWVRRERDRITLLDAHVRTARAEREKQERDPLDDEAEKLRRQVGVLALAAEEGDVDAAFRLDEVEKRLGEIEAQRRRTREAQRARDEREQIRREEERQAQLASAKVRLRELLHQREANRRTQLFPHLVVALDDLATDVYLSAQIQDAQLSASRLNGGSVTPGRYVEDKAQLADLVGHALATRGQLSPYFSLSRIQQGELFRLLADAIAEADARRDGDDERIAAELAEEEATRLAAEQRLSQQQSREEAATP
jgi:hypothetical protein